MSTFASATASASASESAFATVSSTVSSTPTYFNTSASPVSHEHATTNNPETTEIYIGIGVGTGSFLGLLILLVRYYRIRKNAYKQHDEKDKINTQATLRIRLPSNIVS
jgi:beta-lactamase regulating signal transducer with metallopeptidase domain